MLRATPECAKKNTKKFSLEGPRENVFPGPAVALDGPGWKIK